MLEAKMAKSTKTPYYSIDMVNSGGKMAIKEEAYLGKLRSNATHSSFYLFDAGVKDEK